jgi:glucokinase-like ROK family protein
MIDIDPGKASIVSAEVGVGFISAITTNFAGEIVWRRQVEIEKEILPDGVTTRVVRLVRKAAAEGEQRVGPLAGVSVAVPGAVDVESGTVLFAPNLGWREYPFYERLKTKFGVPVFIDNEASFAALGEHFFGSAKGYNEVLYISIGVGIGGGIITAGDLYRGAGGIAGEFGHMTVDIKGSKCACGKTGCWETVASEAALLREVQRETVVESKGSMLHRSDMEMLTALLESARAGDTRTLDALKVICKNLAVGIDSLIKAFNPERVVLGGPLSVLHEFMVPMIDLELQKRPIFDLSHSTEIVSASFGADASMMGGVAIIVRSILSNPTR